LIGGKEMVIKFDNDKQLNGFIMKYIQERIEEIVMHYQDEIISVFLDNGFVVVDGDDYYGVDNVNKDFNKC